MIEVNKGLKQEASTKLKEHYDRMQYRIDLLHEMQFQIEDALETMKFHPRSLTAYVVIRQEKELLLEQMNFIETLFK